MGLILFLLFMVLLLNVGKKKVNVVKEECAMHEWAYNALPPNNMVCNKCGFIAGD